jgi:hypothetical protein
MPSILEPGPLGSPPPIGQYSDREAIKVALQAHARDNGWAIKVDSSTAKDTAYICSKGGKYDSRGKLDAVHESKRHRNTGTTKIDCPFRVRATFDAIASQWTTRVMNYNHNHDAIASISALPHRRIGALTDDERAKITSMNDLGHGPTSILQSLR